jgi:signal transduction histidine kinase
VKSLVELHGGDVEIRSEEGKGTTAIVRLPVLPPAVSVAAE